MDRTDQQPSPAGRREFLTQSGGALGGVLLNPAAALLGLLASSSSASSQDFGARAQIDSNSEWVRWRESRRSLHPKILLRSNEAVNTRGEPAGYGVGALVCVPVPQAIREGQAPSRVVVVVAHDGLVRGENPFLPPSGSREGLTALELERRAENGEWAHRIESPICRRWHARSTVPLQGLRVLTHAPAYRVERNLEGPGVITALIPTPWQTLLALEQPSEPQARRTQQGWVLELDPLRGTLIKRMALGRTHPAHLEIAANPGKQVVITMLSSPPASQVFRFTSHQAYDPRHAGVASTLLAAGELSVWDFEGRQWRELTHGENPQAWEDSLLEARELASKHPGTAAPPLGDSGLGALFRRLPDSFKPSSAGQRLQLTLPGGDFLLAAHLLEDGAMELALVPS